MSEKLSELIIVPGHASFLESVSLPLPDDISDDRYWALQPFQKGEPKYYIEHIHRALELAKNNTLVVFSGGRTKKESGALWSEAKTYDEIAKRHPLYKFAHVALEEFARDSLQNVDFSLRLFEEITGHKPDLTTVAGWAFKADRFALHAKTLGLGEDEFRYIGVNNPSDDVLADTLAGENKILLEFTRSPNGDSEILAQRRIDRDPFQDGNPWE